MSTEQTATGEDRFATMADIALLCTKQYQYLAGYSSAPDQGVITVESLDGIPPEMERAAETLDFVLVKQGKVIQAVPEERDTVELPSEAFGEFIRRFDDITDGVTGYQFQEHLSRMKNLRSELEVSTA